MFLIDVVLFALCALCVLFTAVLGVGSLLPTAMIEAIIDRIVTVVMFIEDAFPTRTRTYTWRPGPVPLAHDRWQELSLFDFWDIITIEPMISYYQRLTRGARRAMRVVRSGTRTWYEQPSVRVTPEYMDTHRDGTYCATNVVPMTIECGPSDEEVVDSLTLHASFMTVPGVHLIAVVTLDAKAWGVHPQCDNPTCRGCGWERCECTLGPNVCPLCRNLYGFCACEAMRDGVDIETEVEMWERMLIPAPTHIWAKRARHASKSQQRLLLGYKVEGQVMPALEYRALEDQLWEEYTSYIGAIHALAQTRASVKFPAVEWYVIGGEIRRQSDLQRTAYKQWKTLTQATEVWGPVQVFNSRRRSHRDPRQQYRVKAIPAPTLLPTTFTGQDMARSIVKDEAAALKASQEEAMWEDAAEDCFFVLAVLTAQDDYWKASRLITAQASAYHRMELTWDQMCKRQDMVRDAQYRAGVEIAEDVELDVDDLHF